MLIEGLDDSLSTFAVCDHGNNYVHVSGSIKEDKKDMLATIDTFLALPESEREAHYSAVGSQI